MQRTPVIIKIEMESMRRQISTMLAQEAIDIDDEIKKCIDEYVNEKNLGDAIRATTREVMKLSVQEAVSSFLRYGPGAEAIKAAVHEKLQASLGAIVNEANGDKGEWT